MKSLYITSIERYSGKTAACLALGKRFFDFAVEYHDIERIVRVELELVDPAPFWEFVALPRTLIIPKRCGVDCDLSVFSLPVRAFTRNYHVDLVQAHETGGETGEKNLRRLTAYRYSGQTGHIGKRE